MQIIGTHIAVPWSHCTPFFYGVYVGKLINGRECTIEVDWKTRAFTIDGEQVGTDQILYWLCGIGHIEALLNQIKEG